MPTSKPSEPSLQPRPSEPQPLRCLVEDGDFFDRLVGTLPPSTRHLFERGDLGFDKAHGVVFDGESTKLIITSRPGIPGGVIRSAHDKIDAILREMPYYFVGIEQGKMH